MYLIGLLIWTVIACLVAWALASLLTYRANAAWMRGVMFLPLVPLVVMAPLADEIVGKRQFDKLCNEASGVTIYGTISAANELYTPDGKWRLDIPEGGRDSGVLADSYFRWEHGGNPPGVIPSAAIPIYSFENKIYEKTSNRLLAEWKDYGTSGGWLSQQLETPILVRGSCRPVLVDEGVYKQLAPFHKPASVR